MVEPGHMNLYDRMDPPLRPGAYRLEVETVVALATKGAAPLDAQSRHLQVEGPRFSLLPQEVAGVFPPRNAVGLFRDALPQVVLGRRTLPWEREADAAGRFKAPPAADPPLPAGTPPWMALLIFTEAELPDAAVLRQVPLRDVLPGDVRARLGVTEPESAQKVDAIEVDAALLVALLPGLDELHLLTHVREVSTEDRELSAGDSDGWFAVVAGNRLPDVGKWRACLVSIEGRDDVYNYEPPPPSRLDLGNLVDLVATADVVGPQNEPIFNELERLERFPVRERAAVEAQPLEVFEAQPRAADDREIRHRAALANLEARGAVDLGIGPAAGIDPAVLAGLAGQLVGAPRKRLVLLHTWTFETKAGASFQELCRQLDVGLFSEVRDPGPVAPPVVTDTGHLAIQLTDRAGSPQLAWYRGPLAPWPVTRDPRGPYHSADQCRRLSVETGLEDLSYAAAFEVGRLLAAADARLAQELMRWRRRVFRRALVLDVRRAIGPLNLPAELLGERLVPAVAERLTRELLGPGRPFADPFELRSVRGAEGLRPELLARAWRLASPEQAAALLGPALVAEGGLVVPGVFERPPVGDDLGLEPNLLDRLANAWQQAFQSMDRRMR